MKLAGGWLVALGLIAMVVALLLPTSIDTPRSVYLPSIGETIRSGTQSVLNLGLLQRQALVFEAGLAAIVSGVVLLAAGVLAAAIDRLSPQSADTGLPQAVAEMSASSVQAPQPFTPLDKTKADRFFILVMSGIAMVVFVIFALTWSTATTRAPDPAVAIEENADMLADNMEAMADNLEDLADKTEADVR